MHRHKRAPDHREFEDEIRASQRNILWPDTLRNGASVDRFRIKVSANPTLVQRLGAWLFGVFFFTFGVRVFSLAVEERRHFWTVLGYVAFATLWLFLGVFTFRNGFRRKQ